MVEPTGSWWVEAPDFATAARDFTRDQKVAGDLALPRPVRDYLHELERTQHAEASSLPAKRTP